MLRRSRQLVRNKLATSPTSPRGSYGESGLSRIWAYVDKQDVKKWANPNKIAIRLFANTTLQKQRRRHTWCDDWPRRRSYTTVFSRRIHTASLVDYNVHCKHIEATCVHASLHRYTYIAHVFEHLMATALTHFLYGFQWNIWNCCIAVHNCRKDDNTCRQTRKLV